MKLEVHPDFNISLVASEPLINKPINIDWDAQGRMWVAETPEYPNGRKQPNVELWKDSGSLVRTPDAVANRPAHDRISILIDTDGDGRADKKEVFFEGLEEAERSGWIAVQVSGAAPEDDFFETLVKVFKERGK